MEGKYPLKQTSEFRQRNLFLQKLTILKEKDRSDFKWLRDIRLILSILGRTRVREELHARAELFLRGVLEFGSDG